MFRRLLFTFLFSAAAFCAWAEIPDRPNPPKLVNDLAGIFSAQETRTLEDMLVEFNDSTSNQIVILTTKDIGGYTPIMFAYNVLEKWGVGEKGKDNGIVVLVKPKSEDSKGEVAISVGYGLEGVVTDAYCKRIIELEFIPNFKEGNYYKGIESGVKVLMALCKEEFNDARYKEPEEDDGVSTLIVILALIVLIIYIRHIIKKTGGGSGSSNSGWGGIIFPPFWGPSHGSGGFGGGYGGGFGHGGFGGFGGGHGGGGGASGSW